MNSVASRSAAPAVRLADLDDLHRSPSSSAQAGRLPHPIGSTLPGALSELEGGAPGVSSLAPSTTQTPEPDHGTPAVAREVPRLPAGVVLQLPVRFDGTASGYARVWIVNVLVLLCTLGLAWPWSYRRAQRYLLRHTLVADHRLDYRLSERALWPRMGLAMALWMGVLVAAKGSPWAGVAALSLCGAVWPLLVYLKVQQRVASVAWAGRRLWFDGAWQGAYRATLLSLVLGVATFCSALLSWHGVIHRGWGLTAALCLAWVLVLPVRFWNFFHYRQHHIRLGPLRLVWKSPRVAMLGVFARVVVWSLLSALMAGGLALAGLGVWMWLHQRADARALAVAAGLTGAAVIVLVKPYVEARLINLVWNKTGNRYLRFRSQLPVGPYVRLRVLNVVRVLLTLGMYWPWAVVATRRMRMQSLTVWSRVEPEALLAHWPSRSSDVPPPALPASTMMADASQHTTQPSFVSRIGA